MDLDSDIGGYGHCGMQTMEQGDLNQSIQNLLEILLYLDTGSQGNVCSLSLDTRSQGNIYQFMYLYSFSKYTDNICDSLHVSCISLSMLRHKLRHFSSWALTHDRFRTRSRRAYMSLPGALTIWPLDRDGLAECLSPDCAW